jgi:Holliday junction resolvase RusA-like endonuclease
MSQKRKEEHSKVKTSTSHPCHLEVMTRWELGMVLLGVPVAKERPRFFAVGRSIRCADPQQKIKDEVSKNMAYQIGFSTIRKCTRFEVDIEFYMPIPESFSRLKKNRMLWFEQPNERPDIDNLVKFYLDCANTVVWQDDGMISKINAVKKYSENPRTVIKIIGAQEMEPEDIVKGILEQFSVDEFISMVCDISSLYDIVAESGLESKHKDAALILSRIAKYGDRLKKIDAKYPDAWEKLMKDA